MTLNEYAEQILRLHAGLEAELQRHREAKTLTEATIDAALQRSLARLAVLTAEYEGTEPAATPEPAKRVH